LKGASDILETLQNADNEATEAPYWLIIDPDQMMSPKIDRVASMITGPFFSRADADDQLAHRRYDYSAKAGVWCFSGYYSDKYTILCRSLRIGCEPIASAEGDAEGPGK